MKRVIVALVRGYQKYISPCTAPKCRFYPTCSQYMIEAVETHGALRGFWLGVRRILRCNPFCPGGWDPVPPPRHRQMRARRHGGTE